MPSSKAKASLKSQPPKKPPIEPLEAIFEMPGVLIIGLDRKGRIILFNKGCERLSGYKRQEVLGKSFFTLLLPKDQQSKMRKVFNNFLEMKTPSQGINDWVSKKGERRTIEWHNTLTLDDHGELESVFSIGVDVTDKKAVEATLIQLEKAITSSPSGIVITDLEGKITYANQAYLDFIGEHGKRDIIGSEAMKADFGKEIGPKIMEQLRDQGFYSGEYSRYSSDGQLIDVHIIATLIKDENAIPTNLMATVTDISKLKEAEAEYRHLFESVPVGLFRTKPGIGEILDANPALVHMLGFPDKESLIKRKASSFYIDPNARRQWERKVSKEEVVRGFEAQFHRLDGRLIWVLLSSRAVRNSQGKVIYYEGTIEDITDRKHAQEALAESEEKYRLFFENLTDVLLHFDKNLTIIDVSPSIEQHLGYHPDELKGKSYPRLGLIPPELLPQALENTKRLFTGETVPPKEYPFIAKNGSRVWGEVSSKQVFRDGEIIALYSLVRDIHDRKLAEIALKNTNRDLELYASLLRHDLGNDLQVIFSTTEVAQMMTPEDSELHEFIEATRSAADRMSRLLNIFGRPDKEAEKEIVTLIQRVAKEAMKTHKHLTIKVKASPKTKDVRVTGGRLLPIVFVNLFRNSAQYAGETPVVNVKIAQKDSAIQIDVTDNGPGIPKKLLSKLFERGTTTTGGGLGLNLSKRVLEAYGGSIELVTKSTATGAKFRIIIPIEGT